MWKKTSGTPTFRSVDKDVKLCFSGRYYVDVQKASGSKSEDIVLPGSRGAMCLPVAYWAWLVTGRSY